MFKHLRKSIFFILLQEWKSLGDDFFFLNNSIKKFIFLIASDNFLIISQARVGDYEWMSRRERKISILAKWKQRASVKNVWWRREETKWRMKLCANLNKASHSKNAPIHIKYSTLPLMACAYFKKMRETIKIKYLHFIHYIIRRY